MLKWKCWTQGDGEVIGGSSLYDMWSNSKAGWQGLKFIQPICQYSISQFRKRRWESSWICANNELWSPMKPYVALRSPWSFNPAVNSEFQAAIYPGLAPKDRGPEPWAMGKEDPWVVPVVNTPFQELRPFVTLSLSHELVKWSASAGGLATLLHWADREMIHDLSISFYYSLPTLFKSDRLRQRRRQKKVKQAAIGWRPICHRHQHHFMPIQTELQVLSSTAADFRSMWTESGSHPTVSRR